MDKNNLIELICSFLTTIGIEIAEKEIQNNSFLPGVEIVNGWLIFNREKLINPGDLLHEAGHIAVTPACDRTQLNGNVTTAKPEKKGEEMAVMLWTYAVCVKLNLNPEIVFHSNGYKGDSNWLLHCYQTNNYIGLPLLEWMGLASAKSGAVIFPDMLKWLRD